MQPAAAQVRSNGAMKAAVGALGRMIHLAHEAGIGKQVARDGIEDGVRAAKRFGKQVRNAVTDARDDLTYRVKRQPLEGVGYAFAAGTVLGIALGFVSRFAFKGCGKAAE